jgi:uncharacterized protein (TIGR02449 family)
MDEINLTDLKLQIETLINALDHLRSENSNLRRKLAKTIQERASLRAKKDVIGKKLKTLVLQIKEELA